MADGIERVGLVAKAADVMPAATEQFLEIPENPTAEGADSAYARYRDAKCDGIVALGGGSVIDSAKVVAAMAAGGVLRAADLLGISLNIDIVKTEYEYPESVGYIRIKYDLFAEDTEQRTIIEVQHIKHRDFFDRFLYYHLIGI